MRTHHAPALGTTLLLALGLTGALSVACAETPPDRLALDPSGPFKMTKKGETETTQVAAFTGKKPYVKAVPATWTSADTSVATVDDKGVITATGSGTTQVTAAAWGLETSADVHVTIVGSVEVAQDVPKPFRMNKPKPHKLKVTVKDDKGNVIEKPLVRYKATNYCVEVDDEGVLTPLADGDCDVIVEVADKRAKVSIETRE